jgi:glyoxylase-like metal-dependent hydrolase (beta-lactamase superfamily II)
MDDDAHPLPRLRTPTAIAEAMLLETDSAAHLLRLARDPKIGRYLLARVGDRAALVDPGTERALADALRASGQPAKVVKAGP